MTPDPLPWYARLVLLRPAQVARNLARVRDAGIVPRVPTRWQVFLGVLRMLHRIVFHPGPIGTSRTQPPRPGWRARLLRLRALRLPFLLREGSVVPLDLSGFGSSPARLRRHLLGTHHEGDAPFYDLRLLACHPGELEALRDEVAQVVAGSHPRGRWLRDLCVYEGYHEELLACVDRALAGDWHVAEGPPHTDASLEEYLAWCATRPTTPAATWAAWRAGELGLDAPAPREVVPPPRTPASAAAPAPAPALAGAAS